MSHTGNPRHPDNHGDSANASRETTGAVAKDSLAAESMQSGGGFSDNKNAHVLGVSGSNSTLNTTDTSGATVLPSAVDGATRERQDALGAGADEKGVSGLKYPEGAGGQAQFTGTHSAEGYAGGPGQQSSGSRTGTVKAGDSDFGASTSGSTGPDSSQIRSGNDAISGAESGSGSGSGTGAVSSSSTGGTSSGSGATGASTSGGDSAAGIRPYVDQAPNYTATSAARSSGTYKPKGDNLEDADITESMPKPKTFTGNVGGQSDPGRLAEQGFLNKNANTGTAAGEGEGAGEGDRPKGESQGLYDVLESERA